MLYTTSSPKNVKSASKSKHTPIGKSSSKYGMPKVVKMNLGSRLQIDEDKLVVSLIYRFMAQYDSVVSNNKQNIKTLIKTKQSIKIQMAEMAVETADTHNDLKKINESSHKFTNEIIKESQRRNKLIDELENMQELINLVYQRRESRLQEHKYVS